MFHQLLNAFVAWAWPAALLFIFLTLLVLCCLGVGIESWHRRRRRLSEAFSDRAHRISFAHQDFK